MVATKPNPLPHQQDFRGHNGMHPMFRRQAQLQMRLLELVAENPGQGGGQLAKMVGGSEAHITNLLRDFEADGSLYRRDGRWFLAPVKRQDDPDMEDRLLDLVADNPGISTLAIADALGLPLPQATQEINRLQRSRHVEVCGYEGKHKCVQIFGTGQRIKPAIKPPKPQDDQPTEDPKPAIEPPKLRKRQQEILDWLRAHPGTHTTREVGEAFGLTKQAATANVYPHLQALFAAGYLTRTYHQGKFSAWYWEAIAND